MWWNKRRAPSQVDTPPLAEYDKVFIGNGAGGTTDGGLYAKDWTGAVRALGGGGGGSYTDEQAQDAVGTILNDSTSIDFTYNDATPSITAEVKTSSITTGMLAFDVATQAELDALGEIVAELSFASAATEFVSSTQLFSAGDLQDITDLDLAVTAESLYMIDASVRYQPEADGLPISLALLSPAGSNNMLTMTHGGDAHQAFPDIETPNLSQIAVTSGTDPQVFHVSGNLRAGATGTCRLMFSGGAVVLAGSRITLFRLRPLVEDVEAVARESIWLPRRAVGGVSGSGSVGSVVGTGDRVTALADNSNSTYVSTAAGVDTNLGDVIAFEPPDGANSAYYAELFYIHVVASFAGGDLGTVNVGGHSWYRLDHPDPDDYESLGAGTTFTPAQNLSQSSGSPDPFAVTLGPFTRSGGGGVWEESELTTLGVLIRVGFSDNDPPVEFNLHRARMHVIYGDVVP